MPSYSLAVADAHWLSLNPKQGLLVPSKFYGIAAAGKPIITIADKNGEIARLVQRHSAWSSHQAVLTRWSTPYDCRPKRQRQFQKWAGEREPCLTRILRGGKRSSDGVNCLISLMNHPASRWHVHNCNRFGELTSHTPATRSRNCKEAFLAPSLMRNFERVLSIAAKIVAVRAPQLGERES